ncbi:MAG: hypothetical protein JXR70_16825 [Spirochaetales bacterium]|nr:hypothetical protein [Spirochaetales bacterium]
MSSDSIDTIKRRMIRNASRIWGYPDVQEMNSFDPVLTLIIGSLAEELYNISNEINESDDRIVEKFLDLLFSQNIFTHSPAHAIAFAKPMQPRVSITDLNQFYFIKYIHDKEKTANFDSRKNIYFTPTIDSTLFDAEVKFLCAGKYLYETIGQFKEILIEAPPKSPVKNSTLAIGLKLNPLIEILDGLSLFFSFKNLQSGDRFYHTLQAAKWKINGKEVVFRNGLESELANLDDSLFELIKNENNISYKACRYVNDFYSRKFTTLLNGNYQLKDFISNGNGPQILTELFNNEKLNLSEKDILWIEIELSHPVSAEEINDLVISTNCFPIINRKLNEYTHSIVKGTNVIPLLTDDLLFDVKKVSDSKDTVYAPLVSIGNDPENDHTYMLRQGGIARFNSRNAKETIKHLIDLVRDEAAAFSVIGTDLISSELKQLDQIISRLEQRMDTSGITNDLNSYLILKSKSDYDKIYVQYWSTTGDEANNIRPGSKLSVHRGMDIDEKSVTLLTQTFGGRQKLSKEDKLNSLRRALLSKGRIVTTEDIKALCFEQFGSDLKTAEVKKGVSLNDLPGKGLSRTLDVHLILKESNNLTSDDIWQKTEELKVRLKQDSSNLLPYRIFIQ